MPSGLTPLSLERSSPSCSLPCHPICLLGRDLKAQFHSPHPLPTRPNPLSYWRETKNPLMCPERASHVRHLGEPRAVTKQSQQQPTVCFKRRPQMAFLPCGQKAPEWLGHFSLAKAFPVPLSPYSQSGTKPYLLISSSS